MLATVAPATSSRSRRATTGRCLTGLAPTRPSSDRHQAVQTDAKAARAGSSRPWAPAQARARVGKRTSESSSASRQAGRAAMQRPWTRVAAAAAALLCAPTSRRALRERSAPRLVERVEVGRCADGEQCLLELRTRQATEGVASGIVHVTMLRRSSFALLARPYDCTAGPGRRPEAA